MHRVTISVQSRKMIGQLYPTRRKAVQSKLLSLKDAGPGHFTKGNLVVEDDIEEGAVDV